MSLCLETIKVYNRTFYHLEFHEERMRRTQQELFALKNETVNLRDVLSIPPWLSDGLYKCRLLYEKTIHHVEFIPYTVPILQSVRLVRADDCSYSYKYADRALFTNLKRGVTEDDILIVRNGLITDCSFANVVFDDGVRLVTPATPLLRGTKREVLLHEKKIEVDDISPCALRYFKKMFLINAMIDLEDNCSIPISHIVPL